MTAEEIYPLIEDNDASQTLDKHAYDHDNQGWGSDDGLREDDLTDRPSAADSRDGEQSGDTQTRSEPESGDGGTAEPEPLTPNEQETLNVQWQQRMAGAAQQAMQAGKLGGELERMIDHLLQPQLPWRMLLARYMTAAARDDYSYMRPSRREGDFILPTLRSHQLELVVAVDTSGSIKERELAEFIAEINALKGQVRARVTLLPYDTRLCEGAPWVFEPWEGSHTSRCDQGRRHQLSTRVRLDRTRRSAPRSGGLLHRRPGYLPTQSAALSRRLAGQGSFADTLSPATSYQSPASGSGGIIRTAKTRRTQRFL